MSHKCHMNESKKGSSLMVKSIWKKFHSFMKAGRLNKVVKLSGLR